MCATGAGGRSTAILADATCGFLIAILLTAGAGVGLDELTLSLIRFAGLAMLKGCAGREGLTAMGGAINFPLNSECDNEDSSDGACVNGNCREAVATWCAGAGDEPTGSSRLRLSLILMGFFAPFDVGWALAEGGATERDGPLCAGTGAGAAEESCPTSLRGTDCFLILIFIDVAAALAPNGEKPAYITHIPKYASGSESERRGRDGTQASCRKLSQPLEFRCAIVSLCSHIRPRISIARPR